VSDYVIGLGLGFSLDDVVGRAPILECPDVYSKSSYITHGNKVRTSKEIHLSLISFLARMKSNYPGELGVGFV
jgi:hypothetical protein